MIPIHKNHLEYVDYSIKSQDWVDSERRQQSAKIRRVSIATKGSFPMKLYHMLEHLEAAGFASIISFQPHGRALRIHLHQRFLNDILPRYFPDINNIASFLRQLNIYGFRRMINNGPDRDSYYHAMFLRGRPDLCSLIERPLKSQHSKRKKYDPMTEPKFYTMPPIQLLSECKSNSDAYRSGEEAVNIDVLSELNKIMPLTDSERDLIEEPTINHSMTPIENRKMPPMNKEEIVSPSSWNNDTGSLEQSTTTRVQYKNQEFGINSTVPFAMKSETETNADMTSDTVTENPMWSFLSSTTNFDSNKSVPADVVAAASSLLATPHDPRITTDVSFAVVDQYCQNLAINILNQTCKQMQSSPINQPGNAQGVEPGNNDSCLLFSHHQYPDVVDDSNMSPFVLHPAAAERVADHDVNELPAGKNDCGDQKRT